MDLRRSLFGVFVFLGGWAAVTAFFVFLFSAYVVFLSGGLLLLSMCGWRVIADMVLNGVWVVETEPDEPITQDTPAVHLTGSRR